MRRLMKLAKPENPCLFLAKGNGDLTFRDRAGIGSLTGSGAVRYQPAPGARINLITNPTFATNAASAIAQGGTAVCAQFAGDSSNGDGFCVDIAATTANHGMVWSTVGCFPVRAKVAHVLSFDANLVSGAGDWRVNFVELDAGGSTLVTSAVQNFTVQAGWNRFAFVYTPIGDGAHFLRFALTRQTSSVSDIHVDELVLEEGSVANPPPPSFNGANNGIWLNPRTGVLGAPHAAASVSRAQTWVEEATTNLINNPSMEVDTTGVRWSAGTGQTITFGRVTTQAYLGLGSFEFNVTASTAPAATEALVGPFTDIVCSAAQVYTASFLARRSSTSWDTAVYIEYHDSSGVFVDFDYLSIPMTLVDAWEPHVFTFTVKATAGIAKMSVNFCAHDTIGASTGRFWVDCQQLELKAFSTSYCDGSLGTGYSWAGTANNSNSSRAATLLSADSAGSNRRVSAAQGSMFVNFKPGPLAVGKFPEFFAVGINGAGADTVYSYFSGAGGRVAAEEHLNAGVGSASPLTPIVAAGVPAQTYAEWKPPRIAVTLVGGVLTVANNVTNSPTGSFGAQGITIGSGAAVNQLDGAIGPIAIYNRPLTAAEAAKAAALGPLLDWSSLTALGL